MKSKRKISGGNLFCITNNVGEAKVEAVEY
jgi:hypothetical protein